MTHDWRYPDKPYSIAHRGASAYAPESSMQAFQIATELGADFWELDIRLSSDGKLIVFHDPEFSDGSSIQTKSSAEIEEISAKLKVSAPLLEDVLALAVKAGMGVYADIKDNAATLPTFEALRAHGIERAILGAFDPNAAVILKEANCTYPRSALVPIGADPFEHAFGADVIHLCWEHMERPQDLLNDALFEQAKKNGQFIALWHEEDPARMKELRPLPVIGICSDRPEMVHPFEAPTEWPVQVVCHRGAEVYAPENTLEAARCAFGAGFDYVEIDLRETSDGELVVFHDPALDRTSNGNGILADYTLAQLKSLDVGNWFSEHFSGEKIPTFDEILALTQEYSGKLYVELKDATPVKVLKQVKAHNMMDRCFFWSFNTELVEQLRQTDKKASIMVRRQDFQSLNAALNYLNPAIIEYAPTDDLEEIPECKDRDIKTMIAYMGKNPDHLQQIIDIKPDMVNLSHPFLFRQLLENRSA